MSGGRFPVNGYKNSTNTWVQGWANDAACVSSTRGTQFWTGHHGTLYSKDQPQAMMKWVWNDAIKAWAERYKETSGTKVQYFIEPAQNTANQISTVGVKGLWTGDYFEFVLPVEDFEAETTLQLSIPLYTRGGPTFWEVKYKDGEEWKSTAVNDLPAYDGATVTADATWAVPYLETSSNVDNMQTVDMLFSNAIKKGEIVIRVQCVDGSIISSAINTVATGKTGPTLNSAGTAAGASFYFYNPGNKSNQDITIDILNI